MDRYLQQLAGDFREAADNVPTSEEVRKQFNIDIPEELEMFAYAELYLRVPVRELSAIVGIEKVVLPPPERLSPHQTIFLCDQMIQLLDAYYFHPVFPDGLPVAIKYRVLYDHWDDKHAFTGEGTIHIEFCDYMPARCPFPEEFCSCKDLPDYGDDYNDDLSFPL